MTDDELAKAKRDPILLRRYLWRAPRASVGAMA
jgi:hypothetical protein